ncbi:hypothetical protein J2W28_004203 [Variovorax boronicumulans]|uniref:hypothetical protein n=1 Tax=Variovorax boronicumulans TaxID=436515 RepID=UPI002789F0F5|nr:hypothetical protein [Variovorax boronicumulans]MDP9993742.1 hypothetical protein [Variovorax boronicumulans]MDQ0005043.1 hypothetical protein [Variovorax boronicumulans]MDQ0073048.1 hypothetical protein [Variovorax boronicumulans]
MSNDIDLHDNGDGDLRDPALRRALDHAPDRDATPDPRTRDEIRKMAHNLAAAPTSASASAANNASAAPWWRRLFGGGDTRARMPWNAAFATVLVAGFVTVLWHREPIPDARLDGEAKVASAPAPAPAAAPTPPAAETASSPAIVAQQAPSAAEAPPAPARDAVREAPDRAIADVARKPAPAAARKQTDAAPAPAPEVKSAPPEPAPAPAEVQSAAVPLPAPPAPAAPVSPPAPAIAPAPPALAAAAPGAAESAARARQKSESAQDESEQKRRSAYAAAPPAPSVAPAPIAVPERAPPAVVAAAPPAPVAPAPLRRELPANASGSAARGGSPNADVSGALRDTAPPRAAAAAKAARSPAGASAFSALDRWTSFDLMRAGLGVQHARGDIEGLAALVNTVARSATTADMQLAAPVEVRLSLYQGGTVIAVLEIAGDQVRWTPQPGGTATVGTPPAPALAALRALLTR